VLRSIIVAGGGIGMLPVFLAAREVDAGRLVNVVEDWTNPGGTVYVVYPQARHVPRKVTAFRNFVVECFVRSASRRL
jgi:DNA-binding transcriptional LysR family regulator